MRNRIFTVAFAVIGVALSVAAGNTIKVKNARDFIKAIGPDRTIEIATTTPLNITEAIDEMIEKGELKMGNSYYNSEENARISDYVTYGSNTDGNGLQVRNCEGLTIRAKGKNATLLASPRYVNVIEFYDCSFIKLEKLILGHTDGGYCDKGVVEFAGCYDVVVDDCDLFGCGTEGFVIRLSNRVTVNRTCVHDCTYHTMHIFESTQVRFNDCVFRNNQQYEQVCVSESFDLAFTGCVFDSLDGPLFNLDKGVYFFSCAFRNCNIAPINDEWYTDNNAILVHCKSQVGGAPIKSAGIAKPSLKLGRWTDGNKVYEVTHPDAYRYVFTCTEGNGDVFAINCLSAENNVYLCCNEFPFANQYGQLNVDLGSQDGHDFVRILDDGHELIKSFYYLGKK